MTVFKDKNIYEFRDMCTYTRPGQRRGVCIGGRSETFPTKAACWLEVQTRCGHGAPARMRALLHPTTRLRRAVAFNTPPLWSAQSLPQWCV